MATIKLTPRRIALLKLLRLFKFLNRRQITQQIYPHDRDGSITRDELRKLKAAGYIRSLRAEVGVPDHQTTVPVYVPTELGCLALARELADLSWQLDVPVPTRNYSCFAHYTDVSGLFLTIQAAMIQQGYVQADRPIFEHDIVRADATEPKDRYKLYTEVTRAPKKIVCVPDACLGITVQGYRRALYFELERGTDSPARMAASKSPGYAELGRQQLFRRHVADATDMRVLAICPNANWRDGLRRELANKPGAEFWLVAAITDITPMTFLHEPIFYRPDAQAGRTESSNGVVSENTSGRSLVRRPVAEMSVKAAPPGAP